MRGNRIVAIDETGIHESMDIANEFVQWQGINRIEQDMKYIFLFVDVLRGYVIPKRSFASVTDAEAFYNQAMEYYKAAAGSK
jgi:hypothetical protein